jgi:site-specific recombinase XerD
MCCLQRPTGHYGAGVATMPLLLTMYNTGARVSEIIAIPYARAPGRSADQKKPIAFGL